MDPSSKAAGAVTPSKQKISRSRSVKQSENIDPNVSIPGSKLSDSPAMMKPEKNTAKKSASRNPNFTSPSPKKKIRERKFVIAKKKKSRNEELDCAVVCEKCKKVSGKSKCWCVAYESLRASQEEFFNNRGDVVEDEVFDQMNKGNNVLSEINLENKENVVDEVVVRGDTGVKRSRERLLEEARETVAITGSGKVKNLVKEFEKLSMRKLGDADEKEVDEVKHDDESSGLKQPPNNALEMQVSSSSFCPSDFFLTSESLGLDARRSYSLDSAQGSISTVTTAGGRRFRRSSTESSGNHSRRHWKRKQPRVTSQKPFMLRTEERGRSKEEEFMKKLRQMMEEEEKMRIPIAQGLPWTTDEPECLVKPPVKEHTRPVDLVLHSDVRAIDRSEFDHQVSVKMSLIDQYRMERERQQKLAEEEEIRRLRKELVPKAQPMPYFDRPFIPKRSVKHPTIPKEPKFHLPEHKKIKCYLSLDDLYAHQH